MATRLAGAVACGSRWSRASVRLCVAGVCHVRGGYRRDHYVSVLAAGVREAAGHLSKGSAAADTSMAIESGLSACEVALPVKRLA